MYPKYLLVFLLLFSSLLFSQQVSLSPDTQKYVLVNAAKVILEHVRVIDGTGKPAVDDQNVVIEGGKIASITAGSDIADSSGASVLHLRGYSVIPGIVGMHNHLFYIARPNFKADWSSESPLLVPQMSFSAPRLYLACGVTTMRTTGSIETYADLNLKRDIDAGKLPGPHLDVTGPYLEGAGSFAVQVHDLSGPDEARQMVDYWADRGVTSFKAYMNITRAELKAAIDEAHKRGFKLTGHLCSVTSGEAAELGIDDLEHSFFASTDFVDSKQPDVCPGQATGQQTIMNLDVNGSPFKTLVKKLVDHHVALTSTLTVFETFAAGRPKPPGLQVLVPELRDQFDQTYARAYDGTTQASQNYRTLLAKGMALEHAFAKAGGLLVAGTDPTGSGGVIPGFSDQRQIELLVEAGFTPLEAITIGTLNGAKLL